MLQLNKSEVLKIKLVSIICYVESNMRSNNLIWINEQIEKAIVVIDFFDYTHKSIAYETIKHFRDAKKVLLIKA